MLALAVAAAGLLAAEANQADGPMLRLAPECYEMGCPTAWTTCNVAFPRYKAQLISTSPSLVPAQFISIAPQRDLTLKFMADLALSKGSYDVWLTLDTSLLDAQGLQIMRVEFVSRKTQHRVH